MNRSFQVNGMSMEIPEFGQDFMFNAGRNAADAMVGKHGIEESRRQQQESLRRRGGKLDDFDRGYLARLTELSEKRD